MKGGSRKKRRSGTGFQQGLERITSSLLRMPKAPAACAGVLLFLLVSWLIVNAIVGSATGMEEFDLHPRHYRCTGRPAWLDPSSEMAVDLSHSIRAVLGRMPVQSMFDEELLERMRRAIIQACPMVEDVRAADKVFPSQVRLQLVLRRPKAVFLRDNRHWYVDSRGVVLFSAPADEPRGSGLSPLPIIVGADMRTTPVAGYLYPDRALCEGALVAEEIDVLKEIKSNPPIVVTAVNVSDYGRNQPSGVVLETRSGARLLWGRSARGSRYSSNDPRPEEKARNLRKILEIRPGLAGVAQVTLSFRSPSYVLEEKQRN